jgi:hypothetical protein
MFCLNVLQNRKNQGIVKTLALQKYGAANIISAANAD